MLRVQFLSFPINTAIKYFGQILMTFPGPESTTAGKVENLAQMIWFCTKNIPTLFNVSCPYGWKMFQSKFDDFSGFERDWNRPGAGKV